MTTFIPQPLTVAALSVAGGDVIVQSPTGAPVLKLDQRLKTVTLIDDWTLITNKATSSIQNVTIPGTGLTTQADGSRWLILFWTGNLATHTISFPASPRDGQEFGVITRLAVASVDSIASVMFITPGSETVNFATIAYGATSRINFIYNALSSSWESIQ